MSKYIPISEMVSSNCKGVTPKYVEQSGTIVLNQKCIHDFMLDYSLAQFVSDDQKISQQKYVKINDILINSTGQGTAGRCAIVTSIPEGYKVTVDSHMLIVRCKREEDVFLLAYHLYQNEEFVMGLLSGSSGQGELDKVRLFKLQVPMPDAIERKAEVQNLISNIGLAYNINSEVITKADNVIAQMFNYWFVQYDFPNKDGNPYSQTNGVLEWNDDLKREIPQGWKVTSLGKISEIVTDGITPDASNDLVYEHYSIPAFDSGKYPWYDASSCIDSGKYCVPDKGILVSKLNPQFKRIWDPINYCGNCICSTEFMPFVAKKDTCHGFLYALLDSDEYQKYMVQCSSSSTGSRKRMAPELCERFIFAFPGDEEIIRVFSTKIDELLQLVKTKRVENKKLLDLREYLFPLLITEQVVMK